MNVAYVALAALIAFAAPAMAAEPTDTIALSAADREAAIEDGAQRASRELPINGLSRQIHGEMGVEVGSRGTRALYGTTIVPLGQTGTAAFSFLTAQGPTYRRR